MIEKIHTLWRKKWRSWLLKQLANWRSAERKRRNAQLRYLAQSVRLEEAQTPKIVHATMVIVSMAVVLFLLWASVTTLEEIAHAQGEIVPKGFKQVVQHLEGGLVKEILAEEGQVVEKGQILLRLDGIQLMGDLERTRLKMQDLTLQRLRLRAMAEGKEPDYSAYSDSKHADMVAEQLKTFEGIMDARRQEKRVLIDQIEQKKNSMAILETKLRTTTTNRDLIKQLYERRQGLYDEGVIPEVRLLETKQRLNDMEGEVENATSQIKLTELNIQEFEGRLGAMKAKNKEDALRKLDDVGADIEQTNEVLQKLNDRVKRLEIRAPVRGLVTGLAVNTIDAVVQPGQTVMEIVPLDSSLVAQIRISPQHIGHVSVGDDVQLKFTTYDFSRYGAVEGKLESISATTFVGDDGTSHYRGIVVFEETYVRDDPRAPIMPGMTLIADIITGKRTILQYLFKPIHLSLKSAFHER